MIQILFIVVGIFFVSGSNLNSAEESPKVLPEAEALKKASVDGKYHDLLKKIKVENDHKAYKDFRDWGRSNTVKYAGHENLPRGHWVYVYPHWYIWRQDAAAQPAANAMMAVAAVQNLAVQKGRGWGPEQATGPPDSLIGGDCQTAWATLRENERDEWLEVAFERAIVPKRIEIHENFNPGAVHKITGYTVNGDEHDLWEGNDPTPAGRVKGTSKIDIDTQMIVKKVRIHLQCDRVDGWNEIDAVGLFGADGKVQWAAEATASTTYANINTARSNGAESVTTSQEKQMAKVVKKLKAVEQELKERDKMIAQLRAENERLRKQVAGD